MADTVLELMFNKPEEKARMKTEALTLGSLVGTWVNVNAATRDIVKIVLTNSGGSLGVHAFGACSPTPCDWGQVTDRPIRLRLPGAPLSHSRRITGSGSRKQS
jgi:hypothetical protein